MVIAMCICILISKRKWFHTHLLAMNMDQQDNALKELLKVICRHEVV